MTGLPWQFFSFEYGAVGAYAPVARGCLFYTAQTCAEAACHFVFEGELGAEAAFTGYAVHGLHHRRGTAYKHEVGVAVSYRRMSGDKAVEAFASVVGADFKVGIPAQTAFEA